MATCIANLQGVLKDSHGSYGDTKSFHCIIEGLYHVRRSLEDVGPDIVHQVCECVVTTESVDPEGHVLHSPACCLSVDKIPGWRRQVGGR